MKNPISSRPLVLAGNALSVLIAATERAHKGLPTTIINTGGPLGGYFAGIDALGKRVDGGMVLYEFSSFAEPSHTPRLDSYDPMKRNDVGRFTGIIRRYVQSLQTTHAVSTPRMWVDGKLLPDMMLGNGIGALHHLSNSAAIHRELAVIDRQVHADVTPWHPANKTAWPLDGSAAEGWNRLPPGDIAFNADTVSRRIHGPTLHQTLFAPFARQVMNRDASHLMALYHRLPWLPMYWPQTLLASLTAHGKSGNLPPTVFNYPVQGTIAGLVQHLALLARNHSMIELIEAPIQRVRRTATHFVVDVAGRGEIVAKRLGWAMTPNRGMAAAGLEAPPENRDRLPLMLGFFRIAESQIWNVISVLHAVDDDTGIYRVTNSTACGTPTEDGCMQLVVEANPNRFMGHHGLSLLDENAVMHAMLKDLATMGIVAPGTRPEAFELKRFEGALPLPTRAAVETFLEARAQMVDALPGIEPMGAAAGPFAFGLSDQIVQGLQVAHRLDATRGAEREAKALQPLAEMPAH
jgi:hypothetical protein